MEPLRHGGARRAWRPRHLSTLSAVVLIPMGLLAFMAYLWLRFGDPLLFSASQRSWHRTWAWPWQTLQAALTRPLAGFPHLLPEQLHAGLDTLWAIGFLVLTVYATRRLPLRYSSFLWLFWIVVLSTPALLGGAMDPVISLPRFLVTAFPFVVFLAATPRRAYLSLTLAVPLLIFNVGTFVSGGWVA
jgi:hypothetical protein